MLTRRQFLATSGAALAASLTTTVSTAAGFNKPLGIQLFAIRAELAKDFEGTLKRVAAAGFHELEFAGYFNKDAMQIKTITDSLNLSCISAHHSAVDLETRAGEIIEFAAKLNLKHLVCSTPKSFAPERAEKLSWNNYMYALTLDDWKANAELFNKFGEKAKKAGLQFAYHNYCVEFRRIDNVVAYDELLRLTDQQLVKIQLDCGWAVAGGASPLSIMQRHQHRIISLHLKDLKNKANAVAPESTANVPLGKGILDWPTLLRAAEKDAIEHYFLEQEPPYVEPIFDSLTASMQYLSHMKL